MQICYTSVYVIWKTCLCHTAIFGQNLGETLLIEHRHRKKRKAAIQKKVPEIVESCVDFLMCHGLEVEGIFRYTQMES